MTLPTEPFGWAESALPADVTEPSSGVRDSGYQFEDELPHDEFNAVVRGIYRWIDYQRTPVTSTEDLDAEPGMVVQLRQHLQPFRLAGDVDGGADSTIIATNGQVITYNFTSGGTTWLAVQNDTTTVTLDLGAASTWTSMAVSDSKLLITNAGSEQRCYNLADLSLVWTDSRAISYVFSDGVHFYGVGADFVKFNEAGNGAGSGALLWTAGTVHGATLNAGCTFGDGVVYVGGAAGTGGNTVRVYNQATGILLMSIDTMPVVGVGGLVVDAYNLYVSDGSTETHKLDRTRLGAISSALEPIGVFGRLAVDDKFLYLTQNDVRVACIAKSDFHTISQVLTPDPTELLTIYYAETGTAAVVENIAVSSNFLAGTLDSGTALIWPTFAGVKRLVRAASSGPRHPHIYSPADWGV